MRKKNPERMKNMKIEAKLHTVQFPYPKTPPKRVRIYVPEHNAGEKIPVIYMTDGQSLFIEGECPWGCWNVIETADSFASQGKGVIIVGIDHGGQHRDSELTPASIGEVISPELLDDTFTPLGEEFDRFVVNTVMPYVEEHHPVKLGKEYTAFCGSSSGGLQSFFAGLEHPDLFSVIGAFSPAFLLYSAESWSSWISSKLRDDMPYLYIYTGGGDDMEKKIYFSTELIYDMLLALGYPYEEMNEVIMLEYCHNEKAWGEIFKDFVYTFLEGIE